MKDNLHARFVEDRQQTNTQFAGRWMKSAGGVIASTAFTLILLAFSNGDLPSLNKSNASLPVDHAGNTLALSLPPSPAFTWVLLPENQSNGSCLSGTDCCNDIICYGLEYTPGVSGDVTSYTSGFFIECLGGADPIISNASCTMTDNSLVINECMLHDSILFNSSGQEGAFAVTNGMPVILHQVCFSLSFGESILISEDPITDLTVSIDLTGGGFMDEFPSYTPTTISKPLIVWPSDMSTTVACLNLAVEPDVPEVFDFCGNPIPALLISTTDNPDPLTCEGFRTYVYEYTDCSGGTHLWNYFYFIEYLPFTVPADGGETVTCINNINVNLVTPPSVNDNCGIPLIPTGPSLPVYDPPAFTCEGTVTYTWTYTDCENNSVTWDYIFTVDQTSPTESGGPVPNDSTITCGLEGLPPLTLPAVVDACGNSIPAPVPVVGGSYAGGCDGAITYTYTYTNCPGVQFVWTYTYTVECFPITLKVFLEGPYQALGDSMKPELNYHHVLPGQDKLLSPSISIQLGAPFTPFGQPYNTPPWSYNGNTGLNFGDPSAPGAPIGVIPYPTDVVDWILVTVREDGILPADNIWTCAGWVHTDGEVTFPETCGALNFDIIFDYYILVQHRNHLGVLSPSGADMLCGGVIIDWDFTAGNSYEPVFRYGEKEVESGIWAMHAANGDQLANIAAINSQDRTTWRILQNALGYSIGDYNMDVSTNSADETVWKNNQNRSSGIIFY